MKQQHQSVLLAGLLAVAIGLAGCAAMRGGSDTGASGSSGSSSSGASGSSSSGATTGSEAGGASGTATGTSSPTSGSSGTSGTSGTSGGSTYDQSGATGSATQGSATPATSDTTSGATATGSATASSASPNSTVVSIELVARPSSGIGGAGTVAGAAVGSSEAGATGSSAMSDRVYRVTLRMDDGSTQVITQETTPDFRSGDRVNLNAGAIQR